MDLRSFFPLSLRLLLVRIRWFWKHYRSIRYDSELFNNVHGPLTYNTDGLATSNNADFMREERFARAYKAAAATNPWPGFTLQWRIHVVCWCAEQASLLPGDFVECGVNTGAYARSIVEYLPFNSLGKKFYLLDTFQGLDPRFISDAERTRGIDNYKYRDSYAEVVETFRDFNVRIIRGPVPDTLSQCDTGQICYLSIDMNNVLPEIAALEYFWEKVVDGGFILLDDYGFPQHELQKAAFDRFAEARGQSILCLPTGQGIIRKTRTSLYHDTNTGR